MARSGIVKSMELDYAKTPYGNIGCAVSILGAIAAGLAVMLIAPPKPRRAS